MLCNYILHMCSQNFANGGRPGMFLTQTKKLDLKFHTSDKHYDSPLRVALILITIPSTECTFIIATNFLLQYLLFWYIVILHP